MLRDPKFIEDVLQHAEEVAAEVRAREVARTRDRFHGVSSDELMKFARFIEDIVTVQLSGPTRQCCKSREEAIEFLAAFGWVMNLHKQEVERLLLAQISMEHVGAA